ncbi:DUF2272 domain-containing protein [Maricaulaceae bacterium EIL42A08]|nr:DUF2272 domain-containing protein [Maricaulaceae bacterium EIL42A08]
MELCVEPKGLNLRKKAPSGDRIALLNRGDRVTVLAPDIKGWLKVRAVKDGQAHTGFVSARYLTPALMPASEALAGAALLEWRRFDCGTGKESVKPYSDYVGEMWAAIGQDLDGTDTQIPWSAAAISWFVRKAAQYAPQLDDFAYSMGHHTYIKQAIKAREANEAAPYWGRKLDEAPARIGDLSVQDRQGKAGVHDCPVVKTYEQARDCHGSFPSHCDLIVGITDNTAFAIGGNVSNSVTLSSYALDDNGHLKAENRVFMLLQLQV